MGFDFGGYLSLLFPGCTYESELLTGGLVNITARARRISPFPSQPAADHGDSTTRPDPPTTLVLKYAPPYIAAVGEAAPFSQDRQILEATILTLFSPDGPLSQLNDPNCVRVPAVISHDSAKFVLALEDLGPLITLWDLFSPSIIDSSPLDTGALTDRCLALGRRVGTFFADVHSRETLDAVFQHGKGDPRFEILNQSMTEDVVFDAAVKPILGRLQRHGGLSPVAAEALYRRVCVDYERLPYPGESCLSMGDCHPGSVLVSPSAFHEDVIHPVDVGAIDWEFATVGGRGVNGDVAQVLASFNALLLSLEPGSAIQEAVRSFVRQLCLTYATRSGLGARVKAAQQGERVLTPDNPDMGILRSALILYGRETINQAVERDWGHGVSNTEMVKAGVWYLERAGDSVEGMLERQNWDELLKEETGIIMHLFGLKG